MKNKFDRYKKLMLLAFCMIDFSYRVNDKVPIVCLNTFVGILDSEVMLSTYVGLPFGVVQFGSYNKDTNRVECHKYSINDIKRFVHLHACLMNELSALDFVKGEVISSFPHQGANAVYYF